MTDSEKRQLAIADNYGRAANVAAIFTLVSLLATLYFFTSVLSN